MWRSFFRHFGEFFETHRKAAFFLESHWGIVPFTPFLYLFIWGATLRIIVEDLRPPRFVNWGTGVYHSWCAINLIGPALYIFVWGLIQAGGRKKVMGLWLRAGIDGMLFSAMVTYHAADGIYARHSQLTETHLFSRYLTGAVLVFMLCLIVRDWLAIAVNLYKARRISHVRQR